MFIKIRLYKKYDFDLCKLYIVNPRYFTMQLGMALRSYIRNLDFSAQFSTFSLTPPPDVIEIKLFLDEQQDADVIEQLAGILPKRRNSFIKEMFRHYLDKNTLKMFLSENTDFAMTKATSERMSLQNTSKHQTDDHTMEQLEIPKINKSEHPVAVPETKIKSIEPIKEVPAPQVTEKQEQKVEEITIKQEAVVLPEEDDTSIVDESIASVTKDSEEEAEIDDVLASLLW